MKYIEILGFEQEIGDAGAVVSGLDGRRQSIGSYMSVTEWKPLNEVCDYYSVKDLRHLQKYYEGFNYLSPGFGVLGAFIKGIADQREKSGKRAKRGQWKKAS